MAKFKEGNLVLPVGKTVQVGGTDLNVVASEAKSLASKIETGGSDFDSTASSEAKSIGERAESLARLGGSGGGSGNTTWYEGSGAPNSGLGSGGDYYVDTDTGLTYRKSGVSVDPDDDFTGDNGESPDYIKWLATSEFTIQSNKLNWNLNESINVFAECYSQYSLDGDFDVQVDFDITSEIAPSTSLHRAMLDVKETDNPSNYASIYRHRSTSSRAYSNYSTGGSTTSVATTDTVGKLRLTRSGSTIKCYYWSGSQWEWNGNTSGATFTLSTSANVTIKLGATQIANAQWAGNFDNFIVNSGTIASAWESNGYLSDSQDVSEANSLALRSQSLARTADPSEAASVATIAEDRASEATSMADRAQSLSREAVETSDISEATSAAARGLSIARSNESQAILDNSIADRAESLGRLGGDPSEAVSIGNRAESLARLGGSGPGEASEANSVATLAEGRASEATSIGARAESMARLADPSEAASSALYADSIANIAEGRASEASSISERAQSIARIAVETSDISEAASVGQLAKVDASEANSIGQRAESVTRALVLYGTSAPGTPPVGGPDGTLYVKYTA